jgi:hypothetical protein
MPVRHSVVRIKLFQGKPSCNGLTFYDVIYFNIMYFGGRLEHFWAVTGLMWDILFGIATRYWLNGLGIESRWRPDFPHPSRPILRHTQPLV